MELYSLDKNRIKENYNRILTLYNNSIETEEKIKLYYELRALSRYIKKEKVSKNISQKEINEYILKKREEKLKAQEDIKDLTIEICYSWCDSLRKLNEGNKTILQRKRITKEEYFSEINLFFETVMPSDKELFDKTFKEQKILVKRQLFLPRQEITFFESIKEYYIKVYYSNLNKIIVRNTIHEFGHASEFVKTGIGRSRDPLMEEVIATLYELLYIDMIFSNDEKSKLIEFSNLFKLIRLSPLENYIYQCCAKPDKLAETFYREINYMYTNIIALSIYLIKDKRNILEVIEYIKANTPYIKMHDILKNIGITGEDLIYTAKNVKKLILDRG